MNILKRVLIGVLSFAGTLQIAYGQPSRVTADTSDFHFIFNGKPFFPLGYYITRPSLAELKSLQTHHVNTVVLYYYEVAEAFPTPPFSGTIHARYLRGLRKYLDTLNRFKIKAMVDLQAKHAEHGDDGFTADGVVEIVKAYKSHPAVLGWLLEEEGYNIFRKQGYPTWKFIKELKSRINAEDPNHPVILVETNTDFEGSTFFGEREQDFHGNQLYDALGYDKYVFDGRKGREGAEYTDLNLVTREAVNRTMPQIIANHKYGLFFVAQCVDKSHELDNPGYPPLTTDQIWYESLSPIIHGARGVLFWWWQPNPASDFYSSPTTLRNTLKFFDWFSRNNLVEVITKGIDKKQAVRLGDGNGGDSLTLYSKDIPLDSSKIGWRSYQWQHFNNYGFHKKTKETRFSRHDDPGLADPNFLLVDFMARQLGNTCYLFVSNDFRLKVKCQFILDRMVPSGRRIAKVVELNPSGKEMPIVVRNNKSITVRLDGHSTTVYKIVTGAH